MVPWLVQLPPQVLVPFPDCPTGPESVSGKPNGPIPGSITIDGQTLCLDTKVESNLDDWNGASASLPAAGCAVSEALILLTVISFTGLIILVVAGKRRK